MTTMCVNIAAPCRSSINLRRCHHKNEAGVLAHAIIEAEAAELENVQGIQVRVLQQSLFVLCPTTLDSVLSRRPFGLRQGGTS